MQFIINIQKKHFIYLFATLSLILIVMLSTSLPEVDTNQAYHYIQQIALGPNDGNANENVSIDSDGDGVIDYTENADTLDGLDSTDLLGFWSPSAPNDGIFYNDLNKNVGIGTNSPSEKLDVEGKIRTNTIQLDNTICSGSNQKLYTDSSGNIICGTDQTQIDTNAQTICTDNLFLDGDGQCRSASQIVSDGGSNSLSCITITNTGCTSASASCPSPYILTGGACKFTPAISRRTSRISGNTYICEGYYLEGICTNIAYARCCK